MSPCVYKIINGKMANKWTGIDKINPNSHPGDVGHTWGPVKLSESEQTKYDKVLSPNMSVLVKPSSQLLFDIYIWLLLNRGCREVPTVQATTVAAAAGRRESRHRTGATDSTTGSGPWIRQRRGSTASMLKLLLVEYLIRPHFGAQKLSLPMR